MATYQGELETCKKGGNTKMDQNILTRRSLRATIFATALSLVLCLLVLATPNQAAAQTDNDANRPAAQQPDNDRNQPAVQKPDRDDMSDRKSTRLNSSHSQISYAVFCLKKKKNTLVN